ncbi:MAG: nucleotidyltransferase family protein [Xanthomonadales bacterium]|nr:nucleotidyltransferase family protein [Xanthomonadales bacterium]
MEAAAEEGVAALLAQRWSVSPSLAHPLRLALQRHLRQAALDELARDAFERTILRQLAAAGIVCVVLKGAALARWLYPQPFQRPRADLDLLFSRREELAAAETALARVGFRWNGVLTNGPSFERVLIGNLAGQEHHVDAHWRLANHPVFADSFDFAELLRASQPLASLAGSPALGKVHALAHACLHRVNNLLDGRGDRLIWLYDIALLTRSLDPQGWSALCALAKAKQIAGPCADGLSASSEFLHAPVSWAVLEALRTSANAEDFDMRFASRRWYFEAQLLARLRWWQRPRQLAQKFFPGRAYMYQRYGLQRGTELPAAYLRRWMDAGRQLLGFLRRGS